MARLTRKQTAERAASAVADVITGKRPIASIAKPTDRITPAQAKSLLNIIGADAETYHELVQAKLRKSASTIADLLQDKLDAIKSGEDKASLMQIAMAMGIIIDKEQAISGTVAPRSVTNIQVNGYSREDAMALLAGKRIERKVESVDAAQDTVQVEAQVTAQVDEVEAGMADFGHDGVSVTRQNLPTSNTDCNETKSQLGTNGPIGLGPNG